ncbi:EAL domain-containing protein [Evansella clarkii]|uniref:EAL domain-containing protein n=1 Tax=Evansella clarkii TaxID=79879 RepID=UPI001F3D17DA|nr:EAL domain-containing protein [Evansella clarkii]
MDRRGDKQGAHHLFLPAVVTRDEEVYGYELLARFKREDGSFLFPGEIFGAAKTRGRLYALDRVCRMTAVRYAERLGNKKAFINFIPTSFYASEYWLKDKEYELFQGYYFGKPAPSPRVNKDSTLTNN